MGNGLEVRTTWQVQVNDLGLISRAVGTSQSLSLEGEVMSKGEVPIPALPGSCDRTHSLHSLSLCVFICEVGRMGTITPWGGVRVK